MTNFKIINQFSDDTEISEILSRALDNGLLDLNDGERLLACNDLNLLGAAADTLRQRSCGDIVTFVIDRNINYTNICTSKCKFCAFYREPDSKDAYVLSIDEILKKVDEAVRLGATQILMQGGLNPDIPIEYYEKMLTEVKKKFKVQMHAFSPPEIVHIGKLYGAGIKETISRLHDAGLDSIPGGGAEILDDRVRDSVSPRKIGWKKWGEVMITAHSLGIPTTATMVFGHAETPDERIRHLIRIREMQEQYHGFTAFIPWAFQSENTELNGASKEIGTSTGMGTSTGIDYLKMVAVSRIFLNGSIRNIQASWVTQGINVAQIALNYGSNDLGGTMIEENVVRAAGVPFQTKSIHEFIRVARKLGRPVAKRDTLYNVIERY